MNQSIPTYMRKSNKKEILNEEISDVLIVTRGKCLEEPLKKK